MNQVIVKGSWSSILDLPANHPVNECGLVFISQPHSDTTICKTYADADDLNKWFCEASNCGPFPIGTLLHWSLIGQVSGPHELAASRKFIDDHFEIVHITE